MGGGCGRWVGVVGWRADGEWVGSGLVGGVVGGISGLGGWGGSGGFSGLGALGGLVGLAWVILLSHVA